MRKKAAQYVRMSSDQQPLSIDIQKAAIQDYANKQNIEIIKTYVDEARSGVTLAGRLSMQQLLRDVLDDACPFEVVLVLDVTRWGRFQDVDEAAYYEFHCRKNGVRVEYVAESFKPSLTPFDSVLKQLKRAMAGEYSRELGVKTRDGITNVVRRGFTAGCLPCLGYRRASVSADGMTVFQLAPFERKRSATDRVKWVLAPEREVRVVQEIFKDYAAGVPVVEMLRKLNETGVVTHDGKSMTVAKINGLLKNEIVIGSFSWGGKKGRPPSRTNLVPLSEPVRNTEMVAPIVDKRTWKGAQARIQEAKRFRNNGLRDSDLIQRLSDAVRADPDLRVSDFQRRGLPSPTTYRIHFGTVGKAYEAAGRCVELAEAALSERRSRAQSRRQALMHDVSELGASAGIRMAYTKKRRSLIVNGAELRIHVARQLASALDPKWQIQHTMRIRHTGSWLLLMRLNEDGQTGKDFFLMPPEVFCNFTGMLNTTSLPAYEPYRLQSADELASALIGIRPRYQNQQVSPSRELPEAPVVVNNP